ncbi:acyltransferase family protein [Frigidibacter sp. ROC022]|uniref:acyltransferase family protein n=1 Tax=Frigidibacter sp. ROC022 TaxID=2971796 RepID=UPI00215AAD79|nr:acyltransferase [Frigidibacter sp. ROC022]MCR8726773.1 acyltransferase [Frigidibacter sp. ROC022]
MVRNAAFDYARLAAAFGIVWFHVGAPGAEIGYAGLPFFLLVLVIFALPGAGRQGFRPFVSNRAQRLMLPFFIWSTIFGLLKLADVALTDSTLASEFQLGMLVTGPALHLWFLPFAFVICLILHPVAHWMTHADTSKQVAAASLSLATLGFLALEQQWHPGIPLQQWLFAMPAVTLGLAMAIWPRAAPAFVGGIGLVALLADWTNGSLQILIAAALVLACRFMPLPESRLSQLCARLSMGIYLCHPLIVSALVRAVGLPAQSVILAVVACLGAASLALVLPGHGSPNLPNRRLRKPADPLPRPKR